MALAAAQKHPLSIGAPDEMVEPIASLLAFTLRIEQRFLCGAPSAMAPRHIPHRQAGRPEAQVGGVDLLATGADHVEGSAAAKGHEGVIPMGLAHGSHGLNGRARDPMGSGS